MGWLKTEARKRGRLLLADLSVQAPITVRNLPDTDWSIPL
jgi:hypothetical protein